MSPFFLLILFTLSTAQQPVDPFASKETVCLYNNLYNLTHDSQSIIFGHHNDNLCGQNFWDYNGLHNESDIQTAVGEYPGFIEFNIQQLLNGVNYTNHILAAMNRGIMIGWHFEANNPLTNGTDHDTSGNAVSELMPGGSANAQWRSMLDEFADFVKSVRLENGNLIPMVMRIFHECLGDWYWWGQNYCSADEYKATYNYTRSYLVNEHNLHNLLFVYAPNKPYDAYGNDSNQYGADRYPGNSVIDIVSMDCYDANDFHVELLNNMRLIVDFAQNNQKIASVGEFGIKDGTQTTSMDFDDWWMSDVYKPIFGDESAYKVAYMNTWANLNQNKWWTPMKGNLTFDSFVEFYQQGNILFEKSVPPLYDC